MTKKYSISYLTQTGLVIVECASKSAALKAAAELPGLLVRVQTPAGNLVTYQDNR